jgi:hypothetical protein
MRIKRLKLGVLVILVVFLAFVFSQRQPLEDWFLLHNYTAPADVAQLATDVTMTDKARHLFYVNHPDITSGAQFTGHCPLGTEKTVVLGCYVGADRGIYLYRVTDSRLQGVEQVTAAHEALHAAYRRLSGSQRSKVDNMLLNYYHHNLSDQRVKDTIAAYQKSEPNDVVNEMHSVFATEIPNLPPSLEQYYKQYFTDRSKITSYTATYQAEFTSRQTLVAQYDQTLQRLKRQTDSNQSTLAQQKASIDSQGQHLQSLRQSGQSEAYNRGIDSYNTAVNNYNSLVVTTRNLINQYNDIVSKRNAVVFEEQQLTKALSATGSNE